MPQVQVVPSFLVPISWFKDKTDVGGQSLYARWDRNTPPTPPSRTALILTLNLTHVTLTHVTLTRVTLTCVTLARVTSPVSPSPRQ